MSCDALDGGREIAIALCDNGRELVDLPGCFRRRFDLDPAADSVEDGFGIEGVGGFLHVVACHCHSGSALARAPECRPFLALSGPSPPALLPAHLPIPPPHLDIR